MVATNEYTLDRDLVAKYKAEQQAYNKARADWITQKCKTEGGSRLLWAIEYDRSTAPSTSLRNELLKLGVIMPHANIVKAYYDDEKAHRLLRQIVAAFNELRVRISNHEYFNDVDLLEQLAKIAEEPCRPTPFEVVEYIVIEPPRFDMKKQFFRDWWVFSNYPGDKLSMVTIEP
jgi:hypothetical protein